MGDSVFWIRSLRLWVLVKKPETNELVSLCVFHQSDLGFLKCEMCYVIGDTRPLCVPLVLAALSARTLDLDRWFMELSASSSLGSQAVCTLKGIWDHAKNQTEREREREIDR